MEWQKYVQEAVKTAPEQSPEMQLVQAGLGLPDELRELEEAGYHDDVREEVGDCFWYLALMVDALEKLTDELEWRKVPPWEWDSAPTARRELTLAAKISGVCEASVCQEADVESETVTLRHCIGNIADYLEGQYPQETVDVRCRNIAKLRDRHGESFSKAPEQDR